MMRLKGVSDSMCVTRLAPASVADGEHEPVLDDPEVERIGAVVAAFEREAVLLEDVEDRDLALMLDVRVVKSPSTSRRA